MKAWPLPLLLAAALAVPWPGAPRRRRSARLPPSWSPRRRGSPPTRTAGCPGGCSPGATASSPAIPPSPRIARGTSGRMDRSATTAGLAEDRGSRRVVPGAAPGRCSRRATAASGSAASTAACCGCGTASGRGTRRAPACRPGWSARCVEEPRHAAGRGPPAASRAAATTAAPRRRPCAGTNVRGLAVTRDGGRPAGALDRHQPRAPAPRRYRRPRAHSLAPLRRPRRAAGPLDPRPRRDRLARGARTLWVATDNGVARLRDGVWTRYDSQLRLPPGPDGHAGGEPLAARAAGRLGGQLPLGRDPVRGGRPLGGLRHPLGAAGEPRLQPAADAERRGPGADPLGGHPRRPRPPRARALERHRLAPGAAERRRHRRSARRPSRTGCDTYWIGTVGGMVRLTPQGWERFSTSPAEPTVALSVLNTREEDGDAGLLDRLGGRPPSLRPWALDDLHHPATRRSPTTGSMSLLAVPAGTGTALWVATPQGLRAPGARALDGLPPPAAPACRATRCAHCRDAAARTAARSSGPAPSSGVGRFQGEAWEKVAVPCLPNPVVLRAASRARPGRRRLALDRHPGGRGPPAARRRGAPARGRCQALTASTRPASRSR